MIETRFGVRSITELCEIIEKSFSKDDTILAAVTVVYKVICKNVSGPYSNSGRFYLWEGVVGATNSNRLMIPYSVLVLPVIPANTEITVRRQVYQPTEPGFIRDYTVNNAANSIDFTSSPSLNGLKAIVRIWI